MTTCRFCQQDGLEWSQNPGKNGKHFLINRSTGQPHICKNRVVARCLRCFREFADYARARRHWESYLEHPVSYE